MSSPTCHPPGLFCRNGGKLTATGRRCDGPPVAWLLAIAATAATVLTAIACWLASAAGWGLPIMAGLVLAGAAGIGWLVRRRVARLDDDIEAARRMGMYRLEEPLATGGMGEVWRASHHLLARPAAIKLVKSNGKASLDATSRLRFEREAQVTASLQSPHTVHLYDFGITRDGVFYYVMELLDGMDLDQLVRRHGPMPPARVIHILTQVLDSLAEAHEHGLVHRDIKPANINLGRRGIRDDFVKVLDFGLVRRADGAGSGLLGAGITADDQVSGTPAFMAPEMITRDRAVDGRADLYALGCVAYWLLTGKLVFEAGSAMAMAIAHATETPVPPSRRVRVPIPAGLERLIMRCLEKDPERRPASARELLGELAALDLEPWAPAAAARWWRDSAGAAPPATVLM